MSGAFGKIKITSEIDKGSFNRTIYDLWNGEVVVEHGVDFRATPKAMLPPLRVGMEWMISERSRSGNMVW